MRKCLALLVAILSSGCDTKWGRLNPGEEGFLVQPRDSRLGTVLTTGKIVAMIAAASDSGPAYEASPPMGPLELSPGQGVRAIAENQYAADDDRGRSIEVLILNGPHAGLRATIRRDQFTPRRFD
jgi:hypothetical protein